MAIEAGLKVAELAQGYLQNPFYPILVDGNRIPSTIGRELRCAYQGDNSRKVYFSILERVRNSSKPPNIQDFCILSIGINPESDGRDSDTCGPLVANYYPIFGNPKVFYRASYTQRAPGSDTAIRDSIELRNDANPKPRMLQPEETPPCVLDTFPETIPVNLQEFIKVAISGQPIDDGRYRDLPFLNQELSSPYV
jgi:hypothetical protein